MVGLQAIQDISVSSTPKTQRDTPAVLSPDQLKADIRKHMLNQIGHQIVPDKINARPVPEILMRTPQRKLVRSGGQPVLW